MTRPYLEQIAREAARECQAEEAAPSAGYRFLRYLGTILRALERAVAEERAGREKAEQAVAVEREKVGRFRKALQECKEIVLVTVRPHLKIVSVVDTVLDKPRTSPAYCKCGFIFPYESTGCPLHDPDEPRALAETEEKP